MSLRDEAITHMAQAVWPNDYKTTPMVTTELVEAHLDALLDFLDAHTEEWVSSPFVFAPTDAADWQSRNARLLLAALRGTTEEGGT